MATITINDKYEFDSSSRNFYLTYNVELESGETINTVDVESNRQWCNVKNTTITTYRTKIELSNNNSLVDREAIVSVEIDTSMSVYSYAVRVIQKAFQAYPIWETRNVRMETQIGYVDYEIRQSNKTIYSGRAYAAPNTNYAEVDISKICSSYINSSLEGKIDNPSNFIANDGVKNFALYVNGNLEGSFLFFNSYTYAPNPPFLTLLTNETYMVLSDPIRKGYDRRQYIVYSFYNALTSSGFGMNVYFKQGINSTRVYSSLNGRTEYTTFLTAPSGYDTVEILGNEYPIIDTCCKYCLYYQNALGGWDSFLIHGNDKRTDKITSYKYIKAVDNTTKAFGTKKYLNVIQPTYKLYTDWMNDDEASRMYHLLESTEVYLHNLEDGTIIPINLTNSNCEFKTFTNNGKKKFYYEIDAELAQPRIRQ